MVIVPDIARITTIACNNSSTRVLDPVRSICIGRRNGTIQRYPFIEDGRRHILAHAQQEPAGILERQVPAENSETERQDTGQHILFALDHTPSTFCRLPSEEAWGTPPLRAFGSSSTSLLPFIFVPVLSCPFQSARVRGSYMYLLTTTFATNETQHCFLGITFLNASRNVKKKV